MGLRQVPAFKMSQRVLSLAQQVGATIMNGYINRLCGAYRCLSTSLFSLLFSKKEAWSPASASLV
jgi:hypothetical protein